MTVEPFKMYTIDSNEHTPGYTFIFPIKKLKVEGSIVRIIQLQCIGWALYSDGSDIVDRRYGRIQVKTKDEFGNPVEMYSWRDKPIISEVKHKMIDDIFSEKPILPFQID